MTYSPCCWIVSDDLNIFALYMHVNNLQNKISALNIVCICCFQDLVPLIKSTCEMYFLNKEKLQKKVEKKEKI